MQNRLIKIIYDMLIFIPKYVDCIFDLFRFYIS